MPDGYVQAENNYCRDESNAFAEATSRTVREPAREALLTKRMEFYELYKHNKAIIKPFAPAKEMSFGRKLARWSLGHVWGE